MDDANITDLRKLRAAQVSRAVKSGEVDRLARIGVHYGKDWHPKHQSMRNYKWLKVGGDGVGGEESAVHIIVYAHDNWDKLEEFQLVIVVGKINDEAYLHMAGGTSTVVSVNYPSRKSSHFVRGDWEKVLQPLIDDWIMKGVTTKGDEKAILDGLRRQLDVENLPEEDRELLIQIVTWRKNAERTKRRQSPPSPDLKIRAVSLVDQVGLFQTSNPLNGVYRPASKVYTLKENDQLWLMGRCDVDTMTDAGTIKMVRVRPINCDHRAAGWTFARDIKEIEDVS